jgi:hypothetical protein
VEIEKMTEELLRAKKLFQQNDEDMHQKLRAMEQQVQEANLQNTALLQHIQYLKQKLPDDSEKLKSPKMLTCSSCHQQTIVAEPNEDHSYPSTISQANIGHNTQLLNTGFDVDYEKDDGVDASWTPLGHWHNWRIDNNEHTSYQTSPIDERDSQSPGLVFPTEQNTPFQRCDTAVVPLSARDEAIHPPILFIGDVHNASQFDTREIAPPYQAALTAMELQPFPSMGQPFQTTIVPMSYGTSIDPPIPPSPAFPFLERRMHATPLMALPIDNTSEDIYTH